MREDSSGCNIKRDLVDRVQPGIGTKKPQAIRFSQGLGTSGLAGAEGLEPSARGFGVDVGEHGRERGKERCWPILPDKSQKSGAGLVLWGIFQAEIRCQIASLRGSSTTGQDLYSSQGSKSMQAAGSRFPSKSQAKVLLRTVRHSLNTCPTRGTQCRLCGTTQFLV